MNLEDFYMEDLNHDTLVFAGNLQVSVTDWFFLKNKADIKYLGLENAVVNLQKSDTLWNYQFLINYFTPTTKSPKKKSGIEFDLKKLGLKNVVFIQKDAWRGEDMIASVGNLEMDANEISLSKKNIDLTSLNLVQPLFTLYTYPGKRSSAPKKDTIVVKPANIADTLLQWNAAGWTMNIASLKINNGVFKNIKQTNKTSLSYFDPNNIEFKSINGQFNNVKLYRDTFSAKVNMNTRERSGFIVRSLKSDVKINPAGMFFSDLDLNTNNSKVRDYFAMTYDDIDKDMPDFIHKVRMQANFDDSQVDSDDLVYFAPALKTWNKNIRITGKVEGTVSDISGRGLLINAGNTTFINGDISLSGLPDINRTFIDFRSNDTRTTYRDIIRFAPAVKNITRPDIAKLGNIHFTGSFTGFVRDFVTFGTIRTDLGTVTTDLNIKLPEGNEPIYSGKISTGGFQLGKFINNPKLGLVSFSGVLRGHGSSANALGIDMNATINEIDYNGYRYRNIVAKGKLEKQLFNGIASVNDPNLQASVNGIINLNGAQSKFNLVADVQKLNLRSLGFTTDSVLFNGKFNLDFTGNNIDNFLGTARLTQANLIRNGRRLTFDSLVLHSDYANGIRTLTARSNEFDGTITGDFHIGDLPNATQLFLNKYYPSYIQAPSKVIVQQNFKFSLVTREVDQFVQLIDKNLKGFNDSKFQGSLDLPKNQLELTAQVPQFSYNQYAFTNTNIQGSGTLNQLSLKGDILNVSINDSINLPNTTFSVIAQHDSSNLKISTAANQAVTKADLNANVITYTDGVKINFDTSSFVLNSKTWTIDKGGELSFRRNTRASGEVVLRESNQMIRLKTIPSNAGSWNDLLVDLDKVNIGDISPYFIPNLRMEGLISGPGKIENPGSEMTATGDFKTQYFRFNGDSLGELSISKVNFDNRRDGNLKLTVTNPDPEHAVHATIDIYLKGSHNDNLISIEAKNYQLKILESFLGNLFSDIQGYATGKIDIKGNMNALDFIGKAHLHDAGLKLKFTQVFYKLKDTDIELRKHELDLGTITLTDTVTNSTATLYGTIQHDSWKNMFFDLDARVNGKPITLLNTTASDNSSFYGHAVGTGSMILVGPQTDMYLTLDGKASENDSSHITIPPAKSRSTGMADFLVERTHGHAVSDSLIFAPASKITYDIGLTADPHTTIEVILDQVTGDVIRGKGRGSLNIHSGTTEPLTLNGSYFLEEGRYLFTFQSFFKRPFELRKGGNSFIKWNGDPLKATIHLDAMYKAEKVSFAPLASSFSEVSRNTTKIQTTRDDVYVIVTMSGELFKPIFDFKLEFPASSIVYSDFILASNIAQIENNPNEINKQVTYLIVFNSFAPVGNTGGATATTASSPITGAISELGYSTLSSLFFNEINRQFGNILAKIFKDEKLKVNISGSVYNRNLVEKTNSNNFNINTGNVNITVGRSFFNDRFTINLGSTLDVPLPTSQTQTSIQQQFQFLPDVSAEWLINPSGSIRATFFYRQNLDFITENNTTTQAKNKRRGGSIAFRKEFDHLGELFHKKREKKTPSDTTAPATETTPAQLPEAKKSSNN